MNKIVNIISSNKDLSLNKNIISTRTRIKIIFLFGWLFGSALSYMIFVNLSSTGGYFLRKGDKELNKIKFQENVLSIEATKIEMNLQNKLNTSFVNYDNSPKSISINVNLNN